MASTTRKARAVATATGPEDFGNLNAASHSPEATRPQATRDTMPVPAAESSRRATRLAGAGEHHRAGRPTPGRPVPRRKCRGRQGVAMTDPRDYDDNFESALAAALVECIAAASRTDRGVSVVRIAETVSALETCLALTLGSVEQLDDPNVLDLVLGQLTSRLRDRVQGVRTWARQFDARGAA